MSQLTLAVCIATYRRVPLLRELLQSLVAAHKPLHVRLEVRIIDNDAARSAAPVAAEFAQAFAALRYTCVEQRNLAAVRNAALDMGPAAWVAFVDDDECVSPTWFTELFDALQRYDADAVFGPVERRLPAAAPEWIRRGGFFESDAPAGRMPWTRARTGNALVKGSWFYDEGIRFAEAYGTTGGEDSELFARLQRRGAVLAWAPRAVVCEPVAPERLRCAWLLQRSYWGGVHLQRLRAFDPRGNLPAPLRTAARVTRGAATCAAGLPALSQGRPERVVRGLQSLALAAGGLAAWLAPARAAYRAAYPSETVTTPGGVPCA